MIWPVWPVLLSIVCSQHCIRWGDGWAGTGRGADTDIYALHTAFPLQLSHASPSRQSEATYDPVSITAAAGRTWWMLACLPCSMWTGIGMHRACRLWYTDFVSHRVAYTSCLFTQVSSSSFVVVWYCSRSSWSSCVCMELNTNNFSSVGLHGLDQCQCRSQVDVRQGQNALGSLLLFTGLMSSHNRAKCNCGS